MKSLIILACLTATSVMASDFRLNKHARPLGSPIKGDYIKKNLEKIPGTEKIFRGQDHVLFDKKNNRMFVFGIDHTLRSIDLSTNEVTFISNTPGIGGGAKIDPLDENKIIFCSTREEGRKYKVKRDNGLYQIDLETKKINPILTNVIKDKNSKRGQGIVFGTVMAPTASISALQNGLEPRSRKMGICDDLAISDDGKRIYIAEPYDTKGGGFGNEKNGKVNQKELLMATQNGKVWLLDREHRTLSLLGTSFGFPDGIAIEKKDEDGKETSILFTEMSRYRIVRINLGEEESSFEYVFKNLPGMPNAMEVDEDGRIYMALNKMRNTSMNIMYNFPGYYTKRWIKKLVLSLPSFMVPVPRKTGFVVLEPNDEGNYDPLFYTVHRGAKLTNIVNVVPNYETGELYMAIYDENSKGIHKIPMPEILK